MNLDGNELTGTIPSWLRNITNLSVFCLNSNRFTGSISPNICFLSSLIVLNLASETLFGSIPNCLNNISKMVATSKTSFTPLEYSYITGDMEGLWLVTKPRESTKKFYHLLGA